MKSTKFHAITSLISLGAAWMLVLACNGSGFSANTGATKPPSANSAPKPSSPVVPGQTNQETLPPDPNPANTNIDQNAGTNEVGLVPLRIAFEGASAGDDAIFTISVARLTAPQDKGLREIIKTAKETYLEGSLEKFCKCGQATEAYFCWSHASNSAHAKGCLHTRNEGEWMLGSNPASGWFTDKLKKFKSMVGVVFLGADTDNPAFIANPLGEGYFRTVTFHPNEPLDSSRSWLVRDDMRFAAYCDVSTCPAGTAEQTTITFKHHPSMDP